MTDFSTVTEIGGQTISQEQLDRTCHRYHWALAYCDGKDVLEVACGSGQGLELLATKAKTVLAGDVSPDVLREAKKTYSDKFDLKQFSAVALPYKDNSVDTLILFEAIYYIDVDLFFFEARRILRPTGILLIVSANCGLYDFTASPFSTRYFDNIQLADLCKKHGFAAKISHGARPVPSSA